ncbi:MAG TPA: oligosaccharide flippase family protein [Chloroflexia bacterium]
MNKFLPPWARNKRAAMLPIGSVRARLASGTFWAVIGAVLSQVLALVAAVIVARLLGRTGFGELGILISTVGTFGIVAGLGLGTTATKYVAELRTSDPARAGQILGLSIWTAVVTGSLASVLLFVLAPVLAADVINAPHLVNELRLSCGVLFFSALNGAQLGVLSGLEAFKPLAYLNVVRGLLQFLLTVAGVVLFGFVGAVLALVAGNALACALYEVAVRRECRRANIKFEYRGTRSEWRILWTFAFPAFMSGAMYTPVVWAGNAALANQPNGLDELGLFNAANQWRMAMMFLPGVLGQVVMPILSNLYGEGRGSSYRKVLFGNLAITFVLSFGAALVLILAAPLIMSAYGSDFTQGTQVLILMLLSTVLTSTSGVVGYSIASQDRMWHAFWLNLIWAAAFGLFVYLFIGLKAYGLALAYLLSYAIHAVTSTLYMVWSLKNKRVADA